MNPAVIGIAGHAKSGKTVLANALRNRLEVPVVSFGTEVRRIAVERGLALDTRANERATLMRLGEELVTNQLSEFCARVLRQERWTPGAPLIIEGIRHASVADELRRLVAPTRLFLVVVDTPATVREQRLTKEGLGGPVTRATMDAHSTEREIPAEVMHSADLVVRGTDPVEVLVEQVISGLNG